jgi:hypothetical protein
MLAGLCQANVIRTSDKCQKIRIYLILSGSTSGLGLVMSPNSSKKAEIRPDPAL